METAMQSRSDVYDFLVRWEPFLLRSNVPMDGIPKQPATPDNPRVSPRLKASGESVGINFTGKCDRVPNTLKCHVLLDYAASVDGGARQNDLAEAMFKAYFTDGDFPDNSTLLRLAQSVGLDASQCEQELANDEKLAVARQKAQAWSRQGINGVPYFIMNGHAMFSGAQEVDTFVKVFDKLAAQLSTASGSKDTAGASGSSL